ncbi:MAG: DUF1553 domain-containing protein [Bryobacterales bacterium]
MRRSAIGLFCFALAATLSGQSTEPDDAHHQLQKRDFRNELSTLTDTLARPASQTPPEQIVRRNFIDRYIFDKMERDGVPHAALADDAVFYRRIHLDLTGRIPNGADAMAFAADPSPDKRDRLVDDLVGSPEWRERWTYYFLDLWRASQNRIGFPGRNLFHAYIYDALQLNQPFDELVSEMITASARSNWYVGPSSYLVRWAQFGDNCTEIMHEDTADEMTVMLFKHFMGVNLQCVSCHDGANHLEKVNVWLTQRKRRELWAQAAFFGHTRVMRRVEERSTQDEYLIEDKGREGYSAAAHSTVRVARQGEGMVEPAFIFSDAKPDPNKPLRQELARIFTHDRQFARATVNRFWAEMMGVGIVDPVDEFDLARLDPNDLPEGWGVQPSHPELLEALTDDFIRSGYDLQHLFRTIARSSAYQLSSSFPGEWKASYAPYYARKFVRRLTAEQVYDSMVKATRVMAPIQIPRLSETVDYLVQTRGPADIRATPTLSTKYKKDLQFFTESFGQANREFNEPSREGSIIQAALMMNSPIVKERAKAKRGSYLQEALAEIDLSDAELVDRLFWRFLTRPPSDQEKIQSLSLLGDRGRDRGAEDLQWLLMNKVEFLFNY